MDVGSFQKRSTLPHRGIFVIWRGKVKRVLLIRVKYTTMSDGDNRLTSVWQVLLLTLDFVLGKVSAKSLEQ